MPALEPKNNILNLVQITDSHLFADPAGTLLGLPTSDSLKSVVDLVVQEQQGVDLVLATGDIAQDGSAVSYRRFVELVDPFAHRFAGCQAITMKPGCRQLLPQAKTGHSPL